MGKCTVCNKSTFIGDMHVDCAISLKEQLEYQIYALKNDEELESFDAENFDIILKKNEFLIWVFHLDLIFIERNHVPGGFLTSGYTDEDEIWDPARLFVTNKSLQVIGSKSIKVPLEKLIRVQRDNREIEIFYEGKNKPLCLRSTVHAKEVRAIILAAASNGDDIVSSRKSKSTASNVHGSREGTAKWNIKAELLCFQALKKLQASDFQRGLQKELCAEITETTGLPFGSINTKIGHYKSLLTPKKSSHASQKTKDIFVKYKELTIEELQIEIDQQSKLLEKKEEAQKTKDEEAEGSGKAWRVGKADVQEWPREPKTQTSGVSNGSLWIYRILQAIFFIFIFRWIFG